MDAPANILGFETLVDGRQVQTALEQKALVGTTDHSTWLTAHRIPLAPHMDETLAALSRLTHVQRAQAIRLGLIDDEGSPVWVLRSIYHWLQAFPAGKPVMIEHRCKTSVGGTVMTGQDPDDETVRTYCIEPPILVTGGNWKKPIGDFRLVVDKGKPATLVSFCGEGVRKIGPTRF